jgi:putative DNA primase/helicase
MENGDFKARVEAVKADAQNRWTEILHALGVDQKVLNKRNQPCPACGGTDRFQYTDKFGNGDYICRGCGHGDGFKLLMQCNGWEFGTALKRVEELWGSGTTLPRAKERKASEEYMKKLAAQTWNEAQAIVAGDVVDAYLRGRGVGMDVYPKTLRFHPNLGYFEKDPVTKKSKLVRAYPAMVGLVQGPTGEIVTVHRTYLENGRKAVGIEPKKLLNTGINGAAIRLADATEELAITEGIEKGLAVLLSTGRPVWPALSCSNREKLVVPDSDKRLYLYGDNDSDAGYDGQASAYALARRVRKEARRRKIDCTVVVHIPPKSGMDWDDIYLARSMRRKQAA